VTSADLSEVARKEWAKLPSFQLRRERQIAKMALKTNR